MTSGIKLALLTFAIAALSACASSEDGEELGRSDLRFLTSDEVCALMTADDIPGEQVEITPETGFVDEEQGGRRAATYVPPADSNREEGTVPADASCTWTGDDGYSNFSLSVLDYSDRPDLLAAADDRLVGAAQRENPPLSVDGYDRSAIIEQVNGLTTVEAVAGPYSLSGFGQFFAGDEEQLALVLDQLFRQWIAAATTVA